MKARNFYFGAMMLPLCSLFFNSCKSDDPIVIPDAKGIKSAGDTIFIEYGKTLDLSSSFTIDPAEATGTLNYEVARQPSFVEGNDSETEYTTVTAYSLSGHTLTSIGGVRVPDAIHATDGRTRVVREGKLKVTLTGGTSTVDPLEVTIIQTEKPALTPTVTLLSSNNYTDGPNGKLFTIQTTGSPRYFTASAFSVSPIDFNPDNIFVRPSSGSQYINAPSASNPATSAGGSKGIQGTGDYVIAFYSEDRSADAIQAAYNKAVALPATSAEVARLYVNVEYVAPDIVVGIVANEEAIGKKATASFWRNNINGRLSPSSFILMQLNDGTSRPYDGSKDQNILGGDFDQYLEGRTDEDINYPGWYTMVGLKQNDPLPEVGTELSFTVTHKAHFKEEGWTVRIITQRLEANPGQ